MTPTTLGVIVGNCGFFPKHLCVSGRETILKVLESEGIRAIALNLDDTPYGSVESLADAHRCADLFKQNRDVIDGVLVTLPNYGDEPDKGAIFHCSNLPQDVFADAGIAVENIPVMGYQENIAGTVGKENTYGTIAGRVRAESFTYCRYHHE